MESLKKQYFKLNREEFKNYLEAIKNNPDTKYFFKGSSNESFYVLDGCILNSYVRLHKDKWQMDSQFNSFSSFGRKLLRESFLIREIVSTNSIDGISSKKLDVFNLMNGISIADEQKISSTLNGYDLLENETVKVENHEDIRKIYDLLSQALLKSRDKAEGRYYRQKKVDNSDDIDGLPSSFTSEEEIEKAMTEFINLFNDEDSDVFEKMLLSHWLIQTVQPYYKYNGRLARFFFSSGLLKDESSSVFPLAISTALYNEKNYYIRALQKGTDNHEFGCINEYVNDMCAILHRQFENFNSLLQEKAEQIRKATEKTKELNTMEKRVIDALIEASILSEFGICYQQIMDETAVSKRSLIYIMNDLKKADMLIDTKVGRTVYHRLDMNRLDRYLK